MPLWARAKPSENSEPCEGDKPKQKLNMRQWVVAFEQLALTVPNFCAFTMVGSFILHVALSRQPYAPPKEIVVHPYGNTAQRWHTKRSSSRSWPAQRPQVARLGWG